MLGLGVERDAPIRSEGPTRTSTINNCFARPSLEALAIDRRYRLHLHDAIRGRRNVAYYNLI
jgi:hypothetical protein